MTTKEHDAVCQTVRSKTISELVGQVGEVITTEQQGRVMALHDRIGKIVEDESQTVIMGRAADARQRDRDRERGEKEVP
jgi:hypothetical protein